MNDFDTPRGSRARRRALRGASLLVVAALAGAGTACHDDALRPPRADAGRLFDRYVALGNSITAGFQSDGINGTTQAEAYPVLLAAAFGTEFRIPSLRFPGCPPPIANVFTGERVGDGRRDDCALRAEPVPAVVHNVAVPGAAVEDILTNLGEDSRANPLTTILLGGRTQLEAAREIEPTFATLWIGNNQVLGPALAGDPSAATPPDVFDRRYRDVAAGLDEAGVRGAALVGVADVTVIPHLSPGAAYWEAERQGALPDPFEVTAACAPAAAGGSGDSTLVPFRYGFGELIARAAAGEAALLDCGGDERLLTADEVASTVALVEAYNATIRDVAGTRGWAYFDPNPVLDSLRAAGKVPPFPSLTPPDALTRPFGRWFSKDGVHPSARTHRLLARKLAEAINARFGTGVPLPAAPR